MQKSCKVKGYRAAKKGCLITQKDIVLHRVYQSSFISYMNLLSSVLVILIAIVLLYLTNTDYFSNKCYIEMLRPGDPMIPTTSEESKTPDTSQATQTPEPLQSSENGIINPTDYDQVNQVHNDPIDLPKILGE